MNITVWTLIMFTNLFGRRMEEYVNYNPQPRKTITDLKNGNIIPTIIVDAITGISV